MQLQFILLIPKPCCNWIANMLKLDLNIPDATEHMHQVVHAGVGHLPAV